MFITIYQLQHVSPRVPSLYN